MRRHRLIQLRVALQTFRGGHEQAVVDGGGDAAEVPGVHLERVFHGGGDAHEFAEHERGFVGEFLRDDEFHGGGVHAVAEGGDHCEVSDGEERVEFVFLDRLVAVVRVCA
jgi:hypothetical protein